MIVASSGSAELDGECVTSLRARIPDGVTVDVLSADSASLDAAIRAAAPADAIVLTAPCRVAANLVEDLQAAAYCDSGVATASALADRASELALEQPAGAQPALDRLAQRVRRQALNARPRLLRAAGPCIYVRRDACELAGGLDVTVPPAESIELDFAARCQLAGLAHVAADDVVVEPLAPQDLSASAARGPIAAAPAVLTRALQIARQPLERLPVTIDARALEGVVTGTHVHTLELVRALAATDSLALRVLLRERRVDVTTLELLGALPETELLFEERLDGRVEPTPVMHRPQQMFAPEDVALAQRLGERLVLSQLDLIAYSNPGYFADAGAWTSFRRASRQGMAAAERVIVLSQHTAQELTASALVEAERISVVPPGLDHGAPLAKHTPAALQAHAGRPFLLCLGTDFRHKNRLFALRLLAALRERHGFDGALVLAGAHIAHGSSQPLESAFLDEHPRLREAVVDLGAVDEPERAWLMGNVAAVVYPSVYEGFGLVPLESALQGVPCLFAATSALAETMPAETATLVPWDAAASADAAAALLGDEQARTRHVQALAAMANGLTWEAAAAATVERYREAAVAPVREAATLSRDASEREAELIGAHDELVARLVGEREHARAMYDELNAEVGWGLQLIGPHGSLPEPLQRALLALSERPALGRPLFALLGRIFLLARVFSKREPGARR